MVKPPHHPLVGDLGKVRDDSQHFAPGQLVQFWYDGPGRATIWCFSSMNQDSGVSPALSGSHAIVIQETNMLLSVGKTQYTFPVVFILHESGRTMYARKRDIRIVHDDE